LILLSIGFVALLGFAFFAFEGGRIYVERQELMRNAADAATKLCTEGIADSGRVLSVGHSVLANDITWNRPPVSGAFAGDKDYIEVTVSGLISGGLVDLASTEDVIVTGQAVVYCGTPASEISLVDGSR
jgi:hypothetical protein